jgi:nucleotide-binding universal stress UspA family protein
MRLRYWKQTKGGIVAIKTLAMATDLSERSDRAMKRAFRIARLHGSRLCVIHAVDDGQPQLLVERQLAAAEEVLQDAVRADPDAAGLDISFRIVAGDPYATILEQAEDIDPDLLVLGIHRKDALRDFFRGTTIERVIRQSNWPVLVAQARPTADYRQVAAAVDFSPASRIALRAGLQLAPTARFSLVHSYDVPYGGLVDAPGVRAELQRENLRRLDGIVAEEIKELQSRLSDEPVFEEPRVRQGSVVEELYNAVREIKADLLVLGTHSRTGIGRAFLGSVAEVMLSDPPTDILIARGW